MDEKDFIKEFGHLCGRFQKIEEEVEELQQRVRALEMKIAYYTGLGTSIGIVVGILVEQFIERLVS